MLSGRSSESKNRQVHHYNQRNIFFSFSIFFSDVITAVLKSVIVSFVGAQA